MTKYEKSGRGRIKVDCGRTFYVIDGVGVSDLAPARIGSKYGYAVREIILSDGVDLIRKYRW